MDEILLWIYCQRALQTSHIWFHCNLLLCVLLCNITHLSHDSSPKQSFWMSLHKRTWKFLAKSKSTATERIDPIRLRTLPLWTSVSCGVRKAPVLICCTNPVTSRQFSPLGALDWSEFEKLIMTGCLMQVYMSNKKRFSSQKWPAVTSH